jgi:hypothetical protein
VWKEGKRVKWVENSENDNKLKGGFSPIPEEIHQE